MAQISIYRKGEVIAHALVDQDVVARLPNVQWNLNVTTGYVVKTQRMGHGRSAPVITLLLHRLITNAPEGMVVDHINGDKLDNRMTNLRVCTNAENIRNQKPKQGKPKGVKFHKPSGK